MTSNARPIDDGGELCAQCRENARWNEAAGYPELAESCRAYCRSGHDWHGIVAREAARKGGAQ
jgi:hypothetical protein